MKKVSLKVQSLEKRVNVIENQSMERVQLWQKGKEIVLNAPQIYVDVDIEADGIAGYGSMLSVGAAAPTGETFYKELKPISELFIEQNRTFCEQHNLERNRLLLEGEDYLTVINDFNSWLHNIKQIYHKPLVFTAFNAAYDWSFVDLYFKLSKIKNPFGIAPFDLKSLALPITNNWNWLETSKAKLPDCIVPKENFTHHALEDALYQQKIHFGLAALLAKIK